MTLDLSKLAQIERRYEEIAAQMADPDVVSDAERLRELAKEHARLEEIVLPYRRYVTLGQDIEAAQALAAESSDPDTREWVRREVAELEAQREALEREILQLLLPRDERDEKNVILEIRAGAGGDEAALFAGDLLRMYTRYAERRGWKAEILSANETGIGGFKEVIVNLSGRQVYSRMKYESGVHRVQRIPVTESGGRIHTSTATVAVLPEAEEVDVQINPEDLEIDTFRASGAGGQHVNKTESAIRITHKPTGIVVTCQDERSQHKNRERAMRILRSKLYELALQEQHQKEAEERRSQVQSGDRSQKIRTYNFQQGRVTDHRIGLTLHKLDFILDGDLDELLDALIAADQAERLQRSG
ncbi:MAG: peptide chain release factor 1 [Clostridia bacterium]|nr:peptide chain release factor 1 [Clostridia bacterium]